jgi:Holliday junction resolvase
MSNTPEGKIKRKVVKVLKDHSVWYFFPASNGFGRAGIPDIIAIVDGLFVGIECKADPTKQPTKLQVQCGELITKAGGQWFLVRSAEDCEQLDKHIENMKKRVVSVSR